jgi:hypothetical protein
MSNPQMTQALVERFLSWPLPKSVRSDLCVTTDYEFPRSGTNLLTAEEARQMIEYLLSEPASASAFVVPAGTSEIIWGALPPGVSVLNPDPDYAPEATASDRLQCHIACLQGELEEARRQRDKANAAYVAVKNTMHKFQDDLQAAQKQITALHDQVANLEGGEPR